MSDSSTYNVLLVEDDQALASMVADFLLPYGIIVKIEPRGDSAASRIVDENPDAVVLDIGLPGQDGLSVLREGRDDYNGAIIMLTARGEEVDEVIGIEAGADDYIAKPVRPRALLARLKMHLRRSLPDDNPGKSIAVGALNIDPSRREVELDGQRVDLTTAEFDLLYLLAKHAGKPLSRNEISQAIHQIKYDGFDRSIDLRISRLRKRLGDNPTRPQRIKSVRGVGYMLALES